ncbi:MAG: MFS transporter [Pseudomonadota bacterium]
MSDAARQVPRLAWFAWAGAAAFFFYAWVLRVNPSVLIDELMAELAVGGTLVGHLSAFYFYGYAGGQIPAGMLLDRFGPRRLMTLAAGVCASGAMLFAASDSIWWLSAGRLLIGAGASFSLIGSMHIAGQWLPAHRYAMLGGIAMGCGMVGGVVGQAPVRVAVDSHGWRDVVSVIAWVGFMLSLYLWMTVRDRSRGSGGLGSVVGGLGRVASQPSNWLNAIAGLGVTGPLLGFGALWGVPFLEQSLGVERAAAAGIASFTLAGMGVGAPLSGWLSDRFNTRRVPLMIGSCTSILSLLTVLFLARDPVSASLACFVIGLSTSTQIVNFAFARDHNPPELRATATGLINGTVTGAGALFQPAIGWVLDLRWDGTLREGVRIYSVSDFQWAFALLLVALAIGFVCAFALRE